MGLRFRQSVRLFPGVRLNLSKSGMSVSVGGPGATLNFSSRGTALTVGLPGSGISLRTSLGDRDAPASSQPSDPELGSDALPLDRRPDDMAAGSQIQSAEVAHLTSPDLAGLKRLINEAAEQKRELEPDLQTAIKARNRAWRRLRRAEQFPLRPFLKNKVPSLRKALEASTGRAQELALAVAGSNVRVDFNFDNNSLKQYRDLEAKYEAAASSSKLWDVTASVWVDAVKTRSVASTAVSRTPVRFTRSTSDVLTGDHRAMALQNANGGDLELFPGFCLIREKGSFDYALVDIRELHLSFGRQRFVEEERLPSDALIVGSAWAKSNKDGSPDRRFNSNHQIPIALYGELRFTSKTGIAEAYHVSNCAAAAEFADSYEAFQRALQQLGRTSTGQELSVPEAGRNLTKEAEDLLPSLQAVGPAHELTALAVAVLLAIPGGLFWWSSGTASVSAPTAVAAHDTSLKKEPAPVPAAMQTTIAAPAATPASTGSPRESVTVRQMANVRAAPNPKASVLRTAPQGARLGIYSRSGEWAQVGEADPWGWVHSSLLAP